MIHYLAYGSNLHPLRLRQRLPNAVLLGRVKLRGYELCFQKRGVDGSAKCDLREGNATSYAALYGLSAADARQLDHYEGGYQRQAMPLEWRGRWLQAYTYQAETDFIAPQLAPFAWYRQLVIEGATAMGFAADYCQRLQAIACQPDADHRRQAQHQQLLEQLRDHPNGSLRQLPWAEIYSAATIS